VRLGELGVVVVQESAQDPEIAARFWGVNRADLRFRAR
jgi:hypothetical protein